MAAYLIADLDIHDPDLAAEYRQQVTPLVAKHGGKYIVRGGDVKVLEGGWGPGRLVVIEFPSVETAQAFYDDPAYRPVMEMRQQSSRGGLVMVEGLPD